MNQSINREKVPETLSQVRRQVRNLCLIFLGVFGVLITAAVGLVALFWPYLQGVLW